MLHKNALQVLVPTIGQQLTLYLDSREKKKEEKKKQKRSDKEAEPMETDETPAPDFEFNEKVLIFILSVVVAIVNVVYFFFIGTICLIRFHLLLTSYFTITIFDVK